MNLTGEITLATIDVVGLYLHIPHNEGIEATLRHLYSDPDSEPPFPRETARSLLSVVLEHNYFEFNGRIYKQIQGTAMGTRVAPSYANLFMDSLETNLLNAMDPKPLLCIDDIYVIWPGDEESIQRMLGKLNDAHPTIKFTSEVSATRAVFLDLEIYKGSRFTGEGKLDIKPHFKATNKFQYLHFSSSHPRSLFSGIVKGELVRILRNSSSEATYRTLSDMILAKMALRNYPRTLLRRARNELLYSNREDTLRDKEETAVRPLPFVCQYADTVPKASLRTILDQGPPEIKPVVAFTRGRNLASKREFPSLRQLMAVSSSLRDPHSNPTPPPAARPSAAAVLICPRGKLFLPRTTAYGVDAHRGPTVTLISVCTPYSASPARSRTCT